MTSQKSFSLHHRILSISMAVLMAVSGTAYASEPIPQEHEATTLEKIQGFTHKASELLMQALSVIGTHYKFGGNSPETGIDCSGLVRYVFKEAWGKNLPRTSAELSRVGQQVSPAQLQPGDLVFYNTRKRKFSHVGIYIGDNKFVHAPSSGGQVRVDNMENTYWRKRFNGARRIAKPEQVEREEVLDSFLDGT